MRRVPTALRGLDDRGTFVRLTLKTDDPAEARSLRDLYEAADDEMWSSLIGDLSKMTPYAATRRAYTSPAQVE